MIASELAKERARRAPFTFIVYYHHAKACARVTYFQLVFGYLFLSQLEIRLVKQVFRKNIILII